MPLFDPAVLREAAAAADRVRLLLRPAAARVRQRAAGRARRAAQAIAELTDALFDALRDPDADVVPIYKAYLAARSAGYMQIESGGARRRAAPSPASELSGYDKIALSVVRAIHFNTQRVIPLSVANRGNIPSCSTTTSSKCRAW